MYFKKSLKTYKVPVLQKDRKIYSSSGEVEREKNIFASGLLAAGVLFAQSQLESKLLRSTLVI